MRLTDADALMEEIKASYDLFEGCEYIGDKSRRDELGSVMARIHNASTIDIVCCGECKHTDDKPPIADGRSWCKKHNSFMYYCSDGEREGE